MIVRKLDGPPYEKRQCDLPKGDLAPGTLGWKGYREERARFNRLQPDRCMRHAKWEVDGRSLCTQHAGIAALEFLSKE